ncbi:MAG: ABC transporter ATP-binding protein/permease [Leifsonia sp.]|uniref:ABC transporter ATP-binding protein/permease n=1 Tax=Leifsonia sp. TaxID=1870902 RepID=UPI003F7FC1B2
MPTLRLAKVRRTVRAGGREVTILRGIDLTINDGDFLAIEGPSGGGKSTLLNVIGALDRPTSGDYSIGPAEVGELSERKLAELRSTTFSFVFQNFHLLERRPAIDSVELGLVYRAVNKKVRRRLALDALKELGIEALANTPSTLLSGGERQRVAVARALASRTPIVIADEPTGNLDAASSAAVVDMLKRTHARGRIVVLVTHSPEVASSGTRRVTLRDGVLVDATPDTGRPPPKPAERVDTTPAEEVDGRPSRLRFRDVLSDAWANLLSRPGRVAGLVAAVAVGVGLTVGTAGIASSARSQVTARFDQHTSRDVTVEWSPGGRDSFTPDVQGSIPERLGEIAGVESAAVLERHGESSFRAGSARPPLAIDAFSGTPHVTRAGRMTIEWSPGRKHIVQSGEVLVGQTLANRSLLSGVSSEPIVFIDEVPFGVAGLIVDSPRQPELLGGILMSRSDASEASPPSKSSALILTQPGAGRQVARQAPLVINPYAPDSLTVSAPSDPRTLRSEIESDVQAILFGFTGLALLAAIAGLANAMVLAVIERKQEFGLRRAIGARRLHIVSLVVAESMSIGVVGGIVGLVLGYGGILVVTIAQRWQPVLDPVLAPVAVIGGVAVGTIGGILAAARAARIQPSDALRY